MRVAIHNASGDPVALTCLVDGYGASGAPIWRQQLMTAPAFFHPIVGLIHVDAHTTSVLLAAVDQRPAQRYRVACTAYDGPPLT